MTVRVCRKLAGFAVIISACSAAVTQPRPTAQAAEPAPSLAPEPDLARMRQLVADKIAVEEKINRLAAHVAAARAELDRQSARWGPDEAALARNEAQLELAKEAIEPAQPELFMIMGELVRTDANERMFIHGMAVAPGGRPAAGASYAPRGMVLLDPTRRDMQLAQVGKVVSNGVYYRGVTEGTNAYGGPASLYVYSHAAPKLRAVDQKMQRRVTDLETLVTAARTRVEPLTAARAALAAALKELTAAKDRLATLNAPDEP